MLKRSPGVRLQRVRHNIPDCRQPENGARSQVRSSWWIVLDPESTIREFINGYDTAGVARGNTGEPAPYAVDAGFQSQ